MKPLFVVLLAAGLAGCQSLLPQPRSWARMDGRPVNQQAFQQARFECLSATNAAQPPAPGVVVTQSQQVVIGGGRPSPYESLARSQSEAQDAILAGARARQASQASEAMFLSCMGGRGYWLP